MAPKEMQGLREQSDAELQQALKDSKHELFNIKFQWMATRQLSSPAQLRALRHKVAQILTVLTEKQKSKEKASA